MPGPGAAVIVGPPAVSASEAVGLAPVAMGVGVGLLVLPTKACTGIHVDMAKDLAGSPGVKARFVATSWGVLMGDPTAGKCDVGMGGVSVTRVVNPGGINEAFVSETEYQAKLHPESCAVDSGEPFGFAEQAYLLPRGDEEFKEYVDQWVHLATHDGTYDRYAADRLG
ncbi:transporter substrate-binding domain-containing protein [Streptomyces sp. NPDC047043]|uniref:transporter substrate-binding domain-containing protein n=1 Tax=Streptomyces sp. NPDC047043 TaxID=3154497 RepID=UPI0033DC455B